MALYRGRTVSVYMIKSISFDFYNTLVQFWPPLDEIQQAACRERAALATQVFRLF